LLQVFLGKKTRRAFWTETRTLVYEEKV
jgi:hypothetical protein